jgi:hypothetical protein
VCERLPRVWELLDRGVIDLSRARVMVDGTFHLEEPDARDVIDRVSERAPRLTTGQLAALIRRLCAETNPDGATSRYEDAVDRRRLVIEQTVDGTGNLYVLDIPISAATAIGRQINGYMISLKNDGDDRLHDQLRADIACDLLLGNVFGSPGSRGKVDIKVDMTTLAGLDEKAGEIVGMGPVVADVARQIADVQQNAEWRLTVADENGRVVHTGITRRRPNRRLSRQIESIHPTCVFPGCRVPAASCDLDHVVAWSDGGPTNVSNLSPKCRHDHRLKDHGWTQHQDAGDHIWSSPLGHTYIVSGQSP